MDGMVRSKPSHMAVINQVLCLGNQTESTHQASVIWADRLSLPSQGLLTRDSVNAPGVYHPDLAYLGLEHIWRLVENMDLTIMLDQPLTSYEHLETYHSLISLVRFQQRLRPILQEGINDPTVWLTDIGNNDAVIDYLQRQQFQNANLVLRLYEVCNLEHFRNQLQILEHLLEGSHCRWILYRASSHEPLHFEATQTLLEYPQFVLLDPAVFQGDVSKNIRRRIYHHWIQLYL